MLCTTLVIAVDYDNTATSTAPWIWYNREAISNGCCWIPARASILLSYDCDTTKTIQDDGVAFQYIIGRVRVDAVSHG